MMNSGAAGTPHNVPVMQKQIKGVVNHPLNITGGTHADSLSTANGQIAMQPNSGRGRPQGMMYTQPFRGRGQH